MGIVDNKSTAVFCKKAKSYMIKSRYREAAVEYLNALIKKEADTAVISKDISKAYKKLKEYKKAIKHLERAKKECSFDSEIYYELGLNYLLCSDFDSAKENFIKTIKLEPNNLNAQIQLAITHELMDEPEMALMIYNKIIEEKPDFILAYNHKAGLYLQNEEFSEAAKVFFEILSIDPEYYRANLGIGICLDKLNMHTKAVRFYKKYISRKPKCDTSKSLVGRIVDIYSSKEVDKSYLKIVG